MKKNKFIILLFILLLTTILIELSILQKPKQSIKSSQIYEFANLIIEKCKSSSYRPNCYDEEVPKLMDQISMEEAFDITRAIQDKDQSFNYCHVLGHKLSSKETAKNPGRWMDIISRCPTNGMCSNGCLHGALQERFRTESLTDEQIEKVIPDLQIACEARKNWNPTQLDQATCYHGLGHLTMYITNANIKKSLSICDRISNKEDNRNYTTLCYEGIFMQLFQPLEPEDFALIKGKAPKKENLYIFCTQFDTKQTQQACWEEGWVLFREEGYTPDVIVNFCSNSPNDGAIDHCFEMLFDGFARSVNFDHIAISKLCNQLQFEKQGQCFAHSALKMLLADKKFIEDATKLCEKADSDSEKDKCFSILADRALYNFHSGSTELNKFCSQIPQNYRLRCLGGVSN